MTPHAFSYDALGRLTTYAKKKDTTTFESQLFSYDANGNRLTLKETENSAQEIQTVYSILENSNRLAKVDNTSYQYDNNGNIINDGEHSYSYDARNRIFAEYDQNGNAIQETVYFGSTPVALLKDGQTYRIFADQIDTPRVLTDSSNTVLWAWDSKPFGESVPNEDVDGDNTKLSYNLRFPGQYYDAETGKHYNFNRDYDPVTGRYIQSDPIGLDGGMDGYLYAKGSSLINFDYTGLVPYRHQFDAARAALKIAIPLTIRHKWEYFGFIYKKQSKFYFTYPQTQRKVDRSGGSFNSKLGNLIGFYHTHPYIPGKFVLKVYSTEDLLIAQRFKKYSFLAGGSRGELKLWYNGWNDTIGEL